MLTLTDWLQSWPAQLTVTWKVVSPQIPLCARAKGANRNRTNESTSKADFCISFSSFTGFTDETFTATNLARGGGKSTVPGKFFLELKNMTLVTRMFINWLTG
jgi:hypothetical protein